MTGKLTKYFEIRGRGGVGGEKNIKLANPKIRLAAERIVLSLLFFLSKNLNIFFLFRNTGGGVSLVKYLLYGWLGKVRK